MATTALFFCYVFSVRVYVTLAGMGLKSAVAMDTFSGPEVGGGPFVSLCGCTSFFIAPKSLTSSAPHNSVVLLQALAGIVGGGTGEGTSDILIRAYSGNRETGSFSAAVPCTELTQLSSSPDAVAFHLCPQLQILLCSI
jgi:hypothetical protein